MTTKNLPCGLAAALLLTSPISIQAEDWPQWRGPNRDGISQETGLLKEWPEGGPELLWKAKGYGVGYSSVSVSGGLIYTLGDVEGGSQVIAANEANGEIVWKTRIGGEGGHRKYPGTRSTPTVDGGQVFALNQFSDLACLDAKSGKLIWKRNLIEDFGGKMMSGWKYSESPLVDGDRVVVTPGGAQGAVVAVNRKNGGKIWQTSEWTDRAGYSSVVIKKFHGVRQYIQLTGQSVAGIDPDSGKLFWKADRPGKTAVVSTPVVKDDVVFVTSAYGVGCSAFRIGKKGSKWTTELLYANKAIANHHGGVIRLGDHVFGSSGPSFACVDIESGKGGFSERSVGKGATVYADGRFYLRAESGPVALIVATPKGLKEAGRFEQSDRSNDRAWPYPVVANGRLYLRDQDALLCYDVRKN